MANITSVNGDLDVSSNSMLTDLDAFSNLLGINGPLQIIFNSSLTNLSGLANIAPTTISDLTIQFNNQLGTCAVESICSYLSVDTNTEMISGNSTGCADRDEVGNACRQIVSVSDISTRDLELFPNPTSGRLAFRNAEVKHVEVYNAQGQRLAQLAMSNQEMDVSALVPGIYHFRIHTANGVFSTQVVKVE